MTEIAFLVKPDSEMYRGLLHDYCLKNQRSLDDLAEFEYLGPAEKADSPA